MSLPTVAEINALLAKRAHDDLRADFEARISRLMTVKNISRTKAIEEVAISDPSLVERLTKAERSNPMPRSQASIQSEFAKRLTEVQRQHPDLNRGEAASKVLSEDPSLYAAYNAATPTAPVETVTQTGPELLRSQEERWLDDDLERALVELRKRYPTEDRGKLTARALAEHPDLYQKSLAINARAAGRRNA